MNDIYIPKHSGRIWSIVDMKDVNLDLKLSFKSESYHRKHKAFSLCQTLPSDNDCGSTGHNFPWSGIVVRLKLNVWSNVMPIIVLN